MEHQYPGAISGDENMLAELMLPDQAHMRNEDWTIFFLHKDTSEEADGAERRKKRKRRKDSDDHASETDGEDSEQGEDESDSLENKVEEEEEEEEEEEDEIEGGEGPPLIYVLNLVNTKQDNTAKRCSTNL